MSLITIFSQVLVVALKMSVIQWFGWSIGVSEIVALMIGLAVSQIHLIHLMANYVDCKEDTQVKRMCFAFRTTCVSLVYSTLISISFNLILSFLCNISATQKFGILSLTTSIGTSLSSCLTYSSLSHQFGSLKNGLYDRFKLFLKKHSSKIMNFDDDECKQIDKDKLGNISSNDEFDSDGNHQHSNSQNSKIHNHVHCHHED